MSLPFDHSRPYYDNVEFTVADSTTDYDVESNNAGIFGGASATAGQPVYYVRFVTDQTVTIKFNSTSEDGITITSNMSPFVLDEVVEVRNVYITNNSGATANCKVMTAKPVQK